MKIFSAGLIESCVMSKSEIKRIVIQKNLKIERFEDEGLYLEFARDKDGCVYILGTGEV